MNNPQGYSIGKINNGILVPSQSASLKLGACQTGLSLTQEEFKLLDQMGIVWLRNSIPWSMIERKPGVWDFSYFDKYMEMAERLNRKVIIVLDYDVLWIHKESDRERKIPGNMLPFFLNYVKKVAERYGRQAAGFEIWNEPNNRIFWKGSDEDFFELTRRSVKLLKQILPDKPVAVGSILYHPLFSGKSYLKKMIRNGVLEGADAVSLHPYGIVPHRSAKRVLDAVTLLRNAGLDKKIWITEIGFPTGGFYLTRKNKLNQAAALVKEITLLAAAGADVITWFKLKDDLLPEDITPGSSSEKFFGLIYPDYRLKPSGKTFSYLANKLQGAFYIQNGIKEFNFSPNKIESYRFDTSRNSSNLVLWSKKKSRVNIKFIGFDGNMEITNLISGEKKELPSNAPITLTIEPVLVHAQLLNTQEPVLYTHP